jgi:hypothetical protein
VRIAAFMICAGFLPACFGQPAKAIPEPALPFYDWGACPGEFRCYGDSLTLPRETKVYDSYKEGRRVVAQLSAGDKVASLNGVVITYQPGVIRLDQDVPDRELRRGDTLLTFSYRGEGSQAVWFQGKYHAEFDISFSKWPNGTCSVAHCSATYVDWGKKSWWIEAQLASGLKGWLEMEMGQASGI